MNTALYRVIYADGSDEAIGAFPVKGSTVKEIADKILLIFNKSKKHRHISVYDLVIINGVTLILTHTGWGEVPESSLKSIMSKVKTT